MRFEPAAQIGAIVLLNGTGMSTGTGIDLASIARRAVRALPPAVELPAVTPEQYRPLLGIYARPELNWMVQLEWRDGRLTFVTPQASTWQLPLSPTDGAPGSACPPAPAGGAGRGWRSRSAGEFLGEFEPAFFEAGLRRLDRAQLRPEINQGGIVAGAGR